MKKSTKLIAVSLLGLAFPALTNAGVFCINAGLTYKIYYAAVDKGYAVTGIRYGGNSANGSGGNTPISGGAYQEPVSGDILIGFDHHFDWGSGKWIHPHGTTLINYSKSTFDTTYDGNGNPINVEGPVSFVDCPSG